MATHAPKDLPDRVWIMGPTGSGKSTLAARLAADRGMDPIHMDEIHWQPGWVEAPREQTIARVRALADEERWVMEGGYTFVRNTLLDRIQAFVWLDLPLRITFPRLVRRGISRSVRKTPCCNGNHETLRKTFFHKDSLLLWSLTHFRTTRRKALETLAQAPDLPCVRLRHPREVHAWLQSVGSVETRTP